MKTRQLVLLIAVVFSPAISFAQHIFIESPAQGDTVTSPTVFLRMSVSSDFELGKDGRILIRVDGVRVFETEALRAPVAIPPGTHEVEAQLVDMRSRPISTSIPDQVKVTMDDWSD
ncbi:MAG TPA: hypothetical protein VN918_11630 [Myxococcaceae bacterium]|nr:hypothetical protein [Myxococcaceae bacterium]